MLTYITYHCNLYNSQHIHNCDAHNTLARYVIQIHKGHEKTKEMSDLKIVNFKKGTGIEKASDEKSMETR